MRILAYVFFVILAAPLEIWGYYFVGVSFENEKWYKYPWEHGLVYAIAILFFFESILRISHNPELSKAGNWKDRLAISIIYYFSWLSALSLSVMFFVDRVRIGRGSPLLDGDGNIQLLGVLFGGAISLLLFIFIEQVKHGSTRQNIGSGHRLQ